MIIFDEKEYYTKIFKINNKQIFAGDHVHISDKFKIGFGWEWTEGELIDFMAILIGADGKIISDDHLVFYNSSCRLKVTNPGACNELASPVKILSPLDFKEVSIESRPTDPEMSVIGDITYRTGAIPFEIKPDNDTWDIDLSKVHPDVVQIIFVANIFNSESNDRRRIADKMNFTRFYYSHQQGLETEYLYIPRGDYSSCGALEICSVSKNPDGWEIQPLGKGHENIKELFKKYLK